MIAPGGDAEALSAVSVEHTAFVAASGITASWADWVAFAHRVVQVDALWREVEARGDAWDEGFGAARDAAAVNPYR